MGEQIRFSGLLWRRNRSSSVWKHLEWEGIGVTFLDLHSHLTQARRSLISFRPESSCGRAHLFYPNPSPTRSTQTGLAHPLREYLFPSNFRINLQFLGLAEVFPMGRGPSAFPAKEPRLSHQPLVLFFPVYPDLQKFRRSQIADVF